MNKYSLYKKHKNWSDLTEEEKLATHPKSETYMCEQDSYTVYNSILSDLFANDILDYLNKQSQSNKDFVCFELPTLINEQDKEKVLKQLKSLFNIDDFTNGWLIHFASQRFQLDPKWDINIVDVISTSTYNCDNSFTQHLDDVNKELSNFCIIEIEITTPDPYDDLNWYDNVVLIISKEHGLDFVNFLKSKFK